MPHGERNLKILRGMQAIGVLKMAVAERTGFTQDAGDILLAG